MPGRPRTMLKKVDRLEVASWELADGVFQAIPGQYRTRPSNGDFIAESWKTALGAAIHAWMMFADLGDALREKAGIPGDGPTAGCRLLRDGAATDVQSPPQIAESAPDTPKEGPGDKSRWPGGCGFALRACVFTIGIGSVLAHGFASRACVRGDCR